MSRTYLVTGRSGLHRLAPGGSADGRRAGECAGAGQFQHRTRDNLAGVRPAPEVIEADLTDAVGRGGAVAGAEVVFHLGALPSVQRSIENSGVTHDACATGTLHVLDAARRAGVRRVVYAASSSAYGGRSAHGGPDGGRCPESPCRPTLPPSWPGNSMPRLSRPASAWRQCRLRFFNIFGPRQRRRQPLLGGDRPVHRRHECRAGPRRAR